MAERLTAIVCDDAPGFRALMSAMLEDAGLSVVGQGTTWEEAEALAPGVDAVVVDLWMPQLDIDALARVRATAPGATLAVITALDVDEARNKVAGHGVDLVLGKTEPPMDVARAVAEHASRRRDAAQPGPQA